ncbi:gloA [Symbiodinium microadriaticum]|nr:gloA [Symbiodinium microadriaticum]
MLRVGDLDKSIDFYTRLLGMTLLSRNDFEGGRFTLAFLGYEADPNAPMIELTHNWDTDSYEIGDGYGHVALGVEDIHAACEALAAENVSIPRPPGPMKHGSTNIAFIEDPDGYKIELIQRA